MQATQKQLKSAEVRPVAGDYRERSAGGAAPQCKSKVQSGRFWRVAVTSDGVAVNIEQLTAPVKVGVM